LVSDHRRTTGTSVLGHGTHVCVLSVGWAKGRGETYLSPCQHHRCCVMAVVTMVVVAIVIIEGVGYDSMSPCAYVSSAVGGSREGLPSLHVLPVIFVVLLLLSLCLCTVPQCCHNGKQGILQQQNMWGMILLVMCMAWL
jgi:hypothetical protein